MERVGVFLIVVALIVGTAGCEPTPSPTPQYDLTITSTDGGSVTTPGEGTFAYDEGTEVSLVAIAEEDYYFVRWTGDVGTVDDADSAETTMTMGDNYSITANFEEVDPGTLFAGGNGTEENPYQIANWCHLHNIRDYLNSRFILINDLKSTAAGYEELVSSTANEGKGWQPIGTHDEPFTGTFDGQGYEIGDLYISRPEERRVGLFGRVGEGGYIEDTGVVDANVTGQTDVGVLVGFNQGHVSNSYSTGSVAGVDMVGGLLGFNNGPISASHFIGSVTGDVIIGGLMGANWLCSVTDSYATGNVIGDSIVGGLIGDNDGGTVSNTYFTGSVAGEEIVGGLVGEGYGTITNSFWDTETSGQSTSDGGTGKTTAEMRDITTFSSAGWNITAVANPSMRNPAYIWNIVDDETYPFLSWEPVS